MNIREEVSTGKSEVVERRREVVKKYIVLVKRIYKFIKYSVSRVL